MLIIRLIKKGKKNSPTYRIVLTQKTAGPKSGGFLEVLGSYNSRLKVKETDKKEISLNKERIEYWLSQGVQVSDTVYNLFVSEGIIKGEKRKKKLKAQKKAAKEEKKEEGKKIEEKAEEAPKGKEEEKPEKPAEAKEEEPEENLDKPKAEDKMEKE